KPPSWLSFRPVRRVFRSPECRIPYSATSVSAFIPAAVVCGCFCFTPCKSGGICAPAAAGGSGEFMDRNEFGVLWTKYKGDRGQRQPTIQELFRHSIFGDPVLSVA